MNFTKMVSSSVLLALLALNTAHAAAIEFCSANLESHVSQNTPSSPKSLNVGLFDYVNSDNSHINLNCFMGSEGAELNAELRKVVEFANAHPDIQDLDIDMQGLNPDAGEILAQLKYVKSLSLYGNHLGEKGAVALSQSTSLEDVNVTDNQITDQGAAALAKINTLIVLNLNDNRITDKGVAALVHSNIQMLDLSDNLLTDDGAALLGNDSKITQLRLTRNNIGDKGSIALAKTTSITYLEIEYNNIGIDGVKALQANVGLQQGMLYLQGNPGYLDSGNNPGKYLQFPKTPNMIYYPGLRAAR